MSGPGETEAGQGRHDDVELVGGSRRTRPGRASGSITFDQCRTSMQQVGEDQRDRAGAADGLRNEMQRDTATLTW